MNGKLYAEIDTKILRRFDVLCKRFGMSKREMLTRMLTQTIPLWERSPARPDMQQTQQK